MGCFASSEEGDTVILPPPMWNGQKMLLQVEPCSFTVTRDESDHGNLKADITNLVSIVKSQAAAGRRFASFFCPPDSRPLEQRIDITSVLLFHVDSSQTLPVKTEIVSCPMKIKDRHFFTSDKKIAESATATLETTLKEWGLRGYQLAGVIDPPVIQRADYGILDSAGVYKDLHVHDEWIGNGADYSHMTMLSL